MVVTAKALCRPSHRLMRSKSDWRAPYLKQFPRPRPVVSPALSSGRYPQRTYEAPGRYLARARRVAASFRPFPGGTLNSRSASSRANAKRRRIVLCTTCSSARLSIVFQAGLFDRAQQLDRAVFLPVCSLLGQSPATLGLLSEPLCSGPRHLGPGFLELSFRERVSKLGGSDPPTRMEPALTAAPQ